MSAGWGGGDLKVIACGLKGVVWEAGGWGGVRWAVVGGGAAGRVGESWDFLSSFFSSFLRLNLARLAVM